MLGGEGEEEEEKEGEGGVTLEQPLIILSIIDCDVMSVCTYINILCMLAA